MNRYVIGAEVIVQGSFSAPSGPVDPVGVNVDVVDPAGGTTTHTYNGVSGIIRVSTGVYTYAIDTTAQAGLWSYRWWSPPTVVGAAQAGQFIVDPFPSGG